MSKPRLTIMYTLECGGIRKSDVSNIELDIQGAPEYDWRDQRKYAYDSAMFTSGHLAALFGQAHTAFMKHQTTLDPNVKVSELFQGLLVDVADKLSADKIKDIEAELDKVKTDSYAKDTKIGKYECELRATINMGNEIAEALASRGIDLDTYTTTAPEAPSALSSL